jgi:hypothetical protein
MKNSLYQLAGSKTRLISLFNLFFSMAPLLSFGQNVNTSVLPFGETPYLRNGYAFMGMHHNTSKSVVLIKRPGYGINNDKGSIGTGFFITTNKDKPHYCLLTAGHNVFAKPKGQEAKPYETANSNMKLSLSYRVTYANGHDGSAQNRTNFISGDRNDTLQGLKIDSWVTVKKAESKRDEQIPYIVDYALILVPTSAIPPNMPVVQHGIDFLSPKDLTRNRLNTDKMKSAYVINHGGINGRPFPQLISTLPSSLSLSSGRVYQYNYNLNGWDNDFYPGSSGAPLVLPSGGYTDDAPAIGILTNDLTGDIKFYSLNNDNIRNAIIENCTGSDKKVSKTSVTTKIALRIDKNTLSGYLTRLRNKLIQGIDKIGIVQYLTAGGSNNDAIATMKDYLQKVNDVDQLCKNINSTDGQLTNGISEMDSKMLTLDQKLSAITWVNPSQPALTGTASQSWWTNFYESLSYTGTQLYDYLKYGPVPQSNQAYLYLQVASARDANSYKSSISLYGDTNPTIATSLFSQEVSSIQENINNVAGLTFYMKRKRRDINAESYQMQAPDELVDLRNKILEIAQLMNNYYANLTAYKSNHVYFFRGLEYYYSYLENNSNRYLMNDFYQGEYLMASNIGALVDEELNRAANYSTMVAFLNEASVKRSELIDRRTKLLQQNYPMGFIKFTTLKPVFNVAYRSFINPSILYNITNFSRSLKWQDLGLGYGSPNEYGFHPIAINSSVSALRVQGAVETYTTAETFVPKIKTSFGSWISTRFSLKGTLVLKNIAQTNHKYLQQYLDRNNFALIKKGLVAKSSGKNEQITYSAILDRNKVPKESNKVAFVVGFNAQNYIKTTTEQPELVTANSLTNEVVNYEVRSPETLILARAWKQVQQLSYTLESATIQPISNLAGNLLLMKDYAERNLTLKYRVEVKDNIGWDYELSVGGPTVAQGRAAASETIEMMNAEESAIPTLSPNPVSDQLYLKLPIGYGRSEITISNITGANIILPILTRANDRLINVRQLQAGMYFIILQSEHNPKHTLKFLKE